MIPSDQIYRRLNNFFDHIYLITLRRSEERHARIREILNGLNYEMFWGVDGNHLTDRQLEEIYDEKLSKLKNPSKRKLTLGEIGCALSHKKVYEDILANGYRNALILEDDLMVNSDTSEILSKALEELPADWELLFLGYLNNNERVTLPIKFRIQVAYPILSMLGFTHYNARQLRQKYPRPYSEHLHRAGYHDGSHAYGVTASGVKKILKDQTPVSLASDNALGFMCMKESINAFMIKQRVFLQNRELPTTITGRYEANPS